MGWGADEFEGAALSGGGIGEFVDFDVGVVVADSVAGEGGQVGELIDHPNAYDALIERIIRLVDAPWDAWPVCPDDQPDYRETQFGEHGLLSFRVDDNAWKQATQATTVSTGHRAEATGAMGRVVNS